MFMRKNICKVRSVIMDKRILFIECKIQHYKEIFFEGNIFLITFLEFPMLYFNGTYCVCYHLRKKEHSLEKTMFSVITQCLNVVYSTLHLYIRDYIIELSFSNKMKKINFVIRTYGIDGHLR